MSGYPEGRRGVFTPEELLARREARGEGGRNHPLGLIRDLPESVKAMTRAREFMK